MKKTIISLTLFMMLLLSCNESAKPLDRVSNNLKGDDNIEIYTAYGNTNQLLISGRALVKEKNQFVDENTSGFSNFLSIVDFFFSNEIENPSIIVDVAGQRWSFTGDDAGYFELDIPSSLGFAQGYEEVNLTLEDNTFTHTTKANIIPNKKFVGIISDIDDTVIVSDVTSKVDLVYNTFWRNYTQREVVPNMATKFKTILAENTNEAPSKLFFISGSPNQLFTPIEKFLELHNFPEHTLILKKIQGDNSDSLLTQITYKTKKIERLIKLYPKMTWVLFGDSGEKDEEIYTAIKEKYPTKIKEFYIRNVETKELKLFD